MRLSIVQHHPLEGPGRVAEWARRRGIAVDLHDATQGALPTGRGPVVLLGGSACSSTRNGTMRRCGPCMPVSTIVRCPGRAMASANPLSTDGSSR
jgi:hypothetical protein